MQHHDPDCRPNHDAQGLPASAAVLHPVHVRVLPRPGQCRLRRTDDEQGSWVQRLPFWAGRRRLLRRLLPLRGPEQPDAREGRRPVLARPHHDHLGAIFRGDGVGQWPHKLCHLALSARRRRGRLLSRHPLLYFHYWFPARHRGRMISWFTVATPISIALGGPISTGLLGLDGTFGLAGWRWVFLVEALPAVILGFVLLIYLRDRPAHASWLTQEEKDWIAGELAHERRELEAVRTYTLFQSLTNIRVVALAVIYFGIITASVGLVIFVPQIIKQLGVSNLQTGFLTMIPYVVGTISMVAWGYVSDRMQERKWNLFIGCLVGAAGLIFAGLLGGSFWSLAAMCLATIGFYGSKGTFWPLPSTFLTGRSWFLRSQ